MTFDLDFTDIAVATQATLPSVIVFRLRYGRSIRVTARLKAVLASASEALERGALIVVDETRIRVRPLPIVDQA